MRSISPWASLGLLAAVTSPIVAASPATAAPRTFVSFGLDGALRSQVDAAPIFAAHGMRATYYVNSDVVGRGTAVGWDALRALATAGHEIGGAGLDKVALAGLAPAEQRREICDDRQALVAHAFKPVSFAYPFGRVDASSETIVGECGYRSARTTHVPDAPGSEIVPPRDPMATRAVTLRAPMPIALMEQYVERAERSRDGWVQFVVGQVCRRCEFWSVSPRRLDLFLRWLTRRVGRGTVVEPVGAVLGLMPRRDHGRPRIRILPLVRKHRWTVLRAQAEDDTGVRVVRFTVDGRRAGADHRLPYRVRWRPRRASARAHRVAATAVDTAGRTRTTSTWQRFR
jgi:polysaccharide deacetylase/Big-like domain-containing protein